MTFQFGDVIFLKAYGIISRLIRLVISVRYGIPFKYAWSHVMMAVDDEKVISAEPSGVKFISLRNNPDHIKCDAVGYRFSQKITTPQVYEMQRVAGEIIGSGYGYFRYALDFLRVFMFYFVVMGIIPTIIFFKTVGWYMVGTLALLLILEKVFWLFDKKAYDCVEAISVILVAGGLWHSIGFRSRSEFPDGMLQVFKNLEVHGAVTQICNKRIGEDF